MEVQEDDTVTAWLRELRAGDEEAAQKLWDRFSERLARLARRRLSKSARVVADEEDVALSAFDSFCRGISQGRFAQLNDRHDLWRLLVTMTLHKVLHRVRYEGRLKRGGAASRADPDFDSVAAADQLLSREPTPELAMTAADECRRLLSLLPSQELVRLALWKFEGFTNEEISRMWDRSERTVERKLSLIRKIWTNQSL